MKILLTGPFGNVGSNVVQFILDSNALGTQPIITLTCLDKKGPMAEASFRAISKSPTGKAALENGTLVVIWGDLTNAEDVKKAIAGQDAIIHLGAVIPPVAYTHPELARKVNVDGTRLLVEACNVLERIPRFIFASSYSVHGPRNPHKQLPLMDGNTPVNAKDVYGKHKVECETMIRKEYKGEWAILRLGAITVTFAGSAYTPISKQMELIMFGIPHNQRRHAVHSKDVARAFINAAKSNQVNGKTLMIGGNDTWKITNGAFYDQVFGALGLVLSPFASRRPPKDADDAFYYEDWMDTTESQQLLKFQELSLSDWRKELDSEVGFVQYWVTRLFSPIISLFLARRSIHHKYNARSIEDPNAVKTMAQLVMEV